MLIKRYLMLVGQLRRLIRIKKVTEIEIKIPDNSDLVKLVLMQRLQRLETKYLILVDWLKKYLLHKDHRS